MVRLNTDLGSISAIKEKRATLEAELLAGATWARAMQIAGEMGLLAEELDAIERGLINER